MGQIPPGFQCFEFLEQQIEQIRPKATILCSEVFALFGLTPRRDSIQRIANRLGHHDVTIYANLRRPDEYLSSWHRQRLKFGERLTPLRGEALSEYLPTAHFQHAQMIRGWLDHFPKANLIVRDFDDVQKSGGSINDFILSSGIRFPRRLKNPGNFNPSIPSAMAEFFRLALHDDDVQRAENHVKWLDHFSRQIDLPADKAIDLFGAENRARLVTEYAGVLADLRKMAGDGLFRMSEPDFGVPRPISDIDHARNLRPALVEMAQRAGHDGMADWLRALNLDH